MSRMARARKLIGKKIDYQNSNIPALILDVVVCDATQVLQVPSVKGNGSVLAFKAHFIERSERELIFEENGEPRIGYLFAGGRIRHKLIEK